jgi:prepilin-type N-terminal cleavage/methylation domain-containing protein
MITHLETPTDSGPVRMTDDCTSSSSRWRRQAEGFTLAEVLVAIAISGMIMTGILASFLMMTRSGADAYYYVGMESEARRALEQFGEDVRMAYAVGTWTSNQDLKLYMTSKTIASSTKDVRYYYDTNSASSTYKCFVRSGPNRVTGAVETKALIHNVQSDFVFTGWNKGSTPSKVTTGATVDPVQIWQLQLGLTIRGLTFAGTDAKTTNLVVSSRYILRNKS